MAISRSQSSVIALASTYKGEYLLPLQYFLLCIQYFSKIVKIVFCCLWILFQISMACPILNKEFRNHCVRDQSYMQQKLPDDLHSLSVMLWLVGVNGLLLHLLNSRYNDPFSPYQEYGSFLKQKVCVRISLWKKIRS